MRREYTRPIMICETFSADEYVAACGESGTTYLFTCDAAINGLGGTVYQETNGIDGLQKGSDKKLGNYSPCLKKHEADSADPFFKGYLYRERLFGPSVTKDVIIWRGEDGSNIHCTTELDQNNWETTKS